MSAGETSCPTPCAAPPIHPDVRARRGLVRLGLVVASGIVLALAGVLYFFNPATSSFYPPCVFSKLTGWSCPGCGGLRAAHHLLHGNVLDALRFNPLVVLVFPVFGAAAAWSMLRPASRWPILCLYATLGVSLAYGVLRNVF